MLRAHACARERENEIYLVSVAAQIRGNGGVGFDLHGNLPS